LIIALPILHASTYGPLASFIPEQFETRLRYTGSAIGYHVGGLLHSGPVPFVAAALFAWAGASWPLAVYIAGSSLLTLIAVACARTPVPDGASEPVIAPGAGVVAKPDFGGSRALN
jgi:hypothetical protein